MVLFAQFLRRDPTQMGQLPYGADQGKQPELTSDTQSFSLREAAYTVQFWVTFSIFFCFGFGSFAIVVHIVPHAIELGISATSAATILSCRGGMGLVGNYVLGGVADRIGNRQIFIVGFIMILAALLWLVPARELWMLYLFGVLHGFTQGGFSNAITVLIGEIFDLKDIGKILGVLEIGIFIGAAIGPYLGGLIFDVSSSYTLAFLVMAGTVLARTMVVALITRDKKRY